MLYSHCLNFWNPAGASHGYTTIPLKIHFAYYYSTFILKRQSQECRGCRSGIMIKYKRKLLSGEAQKAEGGFKDSEVSTGTSRSNFGYYSKILRPPERGNAPEKRPGKRRES